jgi:hypothetical protein
MTGEFLFDVTQIEASGLYSALRDGRPRWRFELRPLYAQMGSL